MKIAINSLTYSEDTVQFCKKLFKLLEKQNIEYMLEKVLYNFLKKSAIINDNILFFNKKSNLKEVDYFFSIGGDGTLLDSLTYIRSKNIPVLGINTGRLGFLATTRKEDIEKTLQQLLEKKYKIEERILIKLKSNPNVFGNESFGLNDFSILKRDTSSMIVVHTFINGEFLNSYWADGIIVSTPSGSTAYSLSCGGPVVMPNSNNFVISPVCPHNLNVRPLVVPADSKITFKIEGRENKFQISLDSRGKVITKEVELSIEKEDFTAKIITTKEYNYLNTLRTKLSWGNDIRN